MFFQYEKNKIKIAQNQSESEESESYQESNKNKQQEQEKSTLNKNKVKNYQKKESHQNFFKEILDYEQFVICVDPSSQRIFTQALNQNVIILEKQVPKFINKQAKQAIKEFQGIINLDKANWLINKEARTFRQRKLPSYLLQKNKSDYPIYLAQNNLSLAFADHNYLQLNIDVQAYQNQFEVYYQYERKVVQNTDANPDNFSRENDNQLKEENLDQSQIKVIELEAGLVAANDKDDIQKFPGIGFFPRVLQVECSIYYGNNLLSSQSRTLSKNLPFQSQAKIQEWITFDNIKVSQLPLESRICFNVIVKSEKNQQQIICSTSLQIFDQLEKINQGNFALNLWPFYRIQPRLICMNQYWGISKEEKNNFFNQNKQAFEERKYETIEEFLKQNFAQLHIQFDNFIAPVYHSIQNKNLQNNIDKKFGKISKQENRQEKWQKTPKIDQLAKLQSLLNADPLIRRNFTEQDKTILMVCRNHYKSLASALQIFLYAVDWSDPSQVEEAHKMLYQWSPIQIEDALPILNAQFPDKKVRLFALQQVSELCDEEFTLFMLELIQILLFEPWHYSPLGELMLERALKNPIIVGHEYFWQMYSQLHIKASYERFMLYIEQFVMLSGSYRKQILNEVIMNQQLKKIGAQIIQQKDRDFNKMKEKTIKGLTTLYKNLLQQQKCFNFPLDYRQQCANFQKEGCRVIDSKKLPLWVATNNYYNEKQIIEMIFKCGDDIRQDQLTIQLIKIMDKIWLENGQDFRMKPYKVIATSDHVGMIEVVIESMTIMAIHKKFGGFLGALDDETIYKFLKEYNQDYTQFHMALENFLKSCAGYCVATYILGIGDRHSGNIMMTKTGHLFHIDFGHFLGNFKKKFNIKRERSPFVFTVEMAFVLGGTQSKLFKKFEQHCTDAYNLVRKHGNFLIDLFLLMQQAGIPELQKPEDIEYLKKQLSLELNNQQATKKFKDAIFESLATTSRRIDNLIHQFKRNK
ncbi:Protein kinase-like domain [Pseudocohnilembus persalinus]|uniref:Protein kinase-like domain n=1 Tax=Pseudocohnilembus persalinus TaxID=266149 RepID=A0A0V0QWY4_PSEPJ|nr:Protein kinase-like domain [Pseudocohnilembus persalinus]|eukprot:KRX06528.1 Protein kinase-like domain [Pseudocohnilembus persalinus]